MNEDSLTVKFLSNQKANSNNKKSLFEKIRLFLVKQKKKKSFFSNSHQQNKKKKKIIGFIGLHIFKVCSTFQKQPFFHSFVNTQEPSVSTILSELPNAAIHLFPPKSLHAIIASSSGHHHHLSIIMSSFESLFDIYAVYIQHPVISKWITIALCVSLFLNTYLFNATKQQVVIKKVVEKVEVPVEYKPAHYVKPSTRKHHYTSEHIRPLEEVLTLLDDTPEKITDEEMIMIVQKGKMAPYALEKVLGDFERAVNIRRALISRDSLTKTLEHSQLPLKNYFYDKVMGACCENVIGYMPIPVGVAGKKRMVYASNVILSFHI